MRDRAEEQAPLYAPAPLEQPDPRNAGMQGGLRGWNARVLYYSVPHRATIIHHPSSPLPPRILITFNSWYWVFLDQGLTMSGFTANILVYQR